MRLRDILLERRPERLLERGAAFAREAFGATAAVAIPRGTDDRTSRRLPELDLAEMGLGSAVWRDVVVAPVASATAVHARLVLAGVPDVALEDVELLGLQLGTAYENCLLTSDFKDSDARYRALVEQLPAVTYYRALDTPGAAFFVSAQVQGLLGYSQQEMLADPELWRRSLHPEDRARVLEEQSTFRPGAAGRPIRSEYRLLHKSGRVVWVENYAWVVRGETGEPRFIMGVVSDVTELRIAEAGRRRSEITLERVMNAGIVGVAIAEIGKVVLEANDTFLGVIGYSRDDVAAGALTLEALVAEEIRNGHRTVLEALRSEGVTRPRELELVRKDGTRVHVLYGSALLPEQPDRAISFVVDVSERHRLEDQLRQAQKLEAIGLLAGGVAHDFNNLLSVILSYAGFLTDALPEGDARRDDVGEIRTAAERAADLTRQLLAFSRRQMLQPRVLDLNAIVTGTQKMLRRLLPESIELRLALAPSVPAVKVDPGQIEQVIMNLAVNARDAMPEGGTLELATRAVPEGLDLSVRDTGTGMDRATLARIFEPFFTTKGQGRGTGLGLSTVHGIVQQSGGKLSVESEVGRGTVFTIFLPAATDAAATKTVATAGAPRGGETILLVEDDPQVRKAVRLVLERAGYRVVECATPADALERCDGIDLLLTDVVMPKMNGRELAEAVRQRRPATRVLYMSGYTDDSVIRAGEGVELVQKPIEAGVLLTALRRILDARSA
jgi:two-component system, cell cycle sensor histidine kinase and response regulator CckA